VGAREVAGRVVVVLVLVDINIDDGAIELGVPCAVGLAVDVETGTVTGVGPRRAVALKVGEDATQVDVIVDDLDGLHRDTATVGSSARLEGPRRVDLAGRGVDDDRADMGFAVDLREVTGNEQLAARQLSKVLHLVIEGERLTVPLPRRRVESGEAAGGDFLAVLALFDAGEVTADVHGRADLLECLDLDVALLDGTIEVTGHAPGHGGSKLGGGRLLLLSCDAAVTDRFEPGVVGTQLRADVGLGVGVDDRSVAVEV